MSDLKNIFTGSDLDAGFIQKILEDNNIGAIVRNMFNESMAGGWIQSQPNIAKVFVDEATYDKALALVDEYLKNNAEFGE